MSSPEKQKIDRGLFRLVLEVVGDLAEYLRLHHAALALHSKGDWADRAAQVALLVASMMIILGGRRSARRRNTRKKYPQHKIWPYLQKWLAINRPNQVWRVDISYIPMRRGFLYLVAIMGWYSCSLLKTLHDQCLVVSDLVTRSLSLT